MKPWHFMWEQESTCMSLSKISFPSLMCSVLQLMWLLLSYPRKDWTSAMLQKRSAVWKNYSKSREKKILKSSLRCKLLHKRSADIVITLLVIIVDNDENACLASKRSSFLLWFNPILKAEGFVPPTSCWLTLSLLKKQDKFNPSLDFQSK